MQAAEFNFGITQGTDWSKIFTLKNGDGSTFDLTGYAAEIGAKLTKTESSFVLHSVDDPPLNITLAISIPDGTIIISQTDTESAELDFETAYWQMHLTVSNISTLWFYGRIDLRKQLV